MVLCGENTVCFLWRRVAPKRDVIRQKNGALLTEAEHFATNQKSLRLPVPKLLLKRWFSWFLICLTLTLTFQGHLIFVHSPFVRLHDWCKFWSYMFFNYADIAHRNMEKLPILYHGDFSLPRKGMLRFRINAIFCTVHRIDPSNMCVDLMMLEADFHFS